MWGETEGFAPRLWRCICFISLSKPRLYPERGRIRVDILRVRAPLFITSNTSWAHQPIQRLIPGAGSSRPGATPVIHYTAVFLSHLVAHTEPYTFVSFVILCQVGTATGNGISSAFIRVRPNLLTTATEIYLMSLNISCTPLVRWGTETPKCVMILLFFVASRI